MLIRMNQAISAAIADEMRADPTVMLWGEDVGESGGVFKATVGLFDEFGADRVRDTPISEMAFLGAAVGAAATGLRPVVEIMFAEFLGVALDQLATEAAMFRYLSAGEYPAGITVRATGGAGLGFGAQHSQMLERWLVGTPGVKVVVPSSARTAYGLLRSAIRDDDPVLVIEPRQLYNSRSDFEPGDDAALPLGRAEKIADGTDVTVVALGSTVITARAASATSNWSVDAIDLLTIAPWDRTAVLESVARTGRLVVVEEGPEQGGWGADIAATVASEGFDQLKGPIVRLTTPNVPIPFADSLEERYLPRSDDVVDAIDELVSHARRATPWWEREGLMT
jgi:pyruvate dehydrogenase E1 component beta subunit